MKKKLMMILAATTLCIVGCGTKPETTPNQETTQVETTKEETTQEETTTQAETTQAEVKQAEAENCSGTLITEVDMSSYEQGKIVRLWVPYAQSDEFQSIENEKVELDDTHAKQEITEDVNGNKILYVEWDAEATERKLTYSFDATRKEILRPELSENGDAPDEAVAKYLEPSSTLPIDGEVKALADKITEGKTTNVEKARAIYDWIIANMERDDDVVGCGLGNVPELLNTLKGKCTDINSVFVALCRASGIPAREFFGVRMSGDSEADMTTGQHCWAQFYLQGTGWVGADPADVLKAVLKNGWEKDSAETKERQEYFWGNMDALRVTLSTGRDLILEPKQEGVPLNNFGYPYAEVDGQSITCYDPENFTYKITYKK